MKPEQFKQKVIAELKTVKKYEVDDLKNFISYWSEKTKSGKLIRYDLQKTFDISRRWGTWKRRAKEYNRKQEVFKPQTPTLKVVSDEDRKKGRAKLDELRKKLFNR